MGDEKRKKPRLYLRTKEYNGKKTNELNAYQRRLENTNKVEAYLNSVMTDVDQIKTAFDIAEGAHMLEQDVREVLEANGHSNGLTF